MAAISPKYPLGSAQEHIATCEKHNINIDVTCQDCDEFICSQCAKTNHRDHDWKTIPTAGSLKKRELKNTLGKIKEEDVKAMDENIQKAGKLMEHNQTFCDNEVFKLQKHYDAIVTKLDVIKQNLETQLRLNLKRKNAEVCKKKLDLEKKREHVNDLVKFLEEKHGSMSDYSLIDNLRDLTSIVSNTDSDIGKGGGHLVRYRRGDISEGLLESMMGQCMYDITVTEKDSFQYKDDWISAMHAINEDTCFVSNFKSKCIKRLNIKNKKTEQINTNVSINDVCVTDNGDVYVTDGENNSIVRLSPSGSFSTVFSTDPLKPVGIYQSTEGGLLVTLRDKESELFQLDSHSRRLVRHVALNSDLIREYEYQEDGQTRLFTVPRRVKQNGNTDICVVNKTSESTGELVILSSSGSLKMVYRGQTLRNKFLPTDVVLDLYCNLIVTDFYNSQIHLLSPDGEFLKYLLTENKTDPMCMSLFKSTLWVGGVNGLLTVFQYKS